MACGNPLGHGGNGWAGGGDAPAVVFAFELFAGWLVWQLLVVRITEPIATSSRMILK